MTDASRDMSHMKGIVEMTKAALITGISGGAYIAKSLLV